MVLQIRMEIIAVFTQKPLRLAVFMMTWNFMQTGLAVPVEEGPLVKYQIYCADNDIFVRLYHKLGLCSSFKLKQLFKSVGYIGHRDTTFTIRLYNHYDAPNTGHNE